MIKDISQAELKQLVRYNRQTGEFRWIKRESRRHSQKMSLEGWNKKYGDKVATSSDGRRYLLIHIDRYPFKAHRLAFLYEEGKLPDLQVDHINQDRGDNRWSNLRLVTALENSRNQKIPKNNKSGVIGVFWRNSRKRWRSQIKVCGDDIRLGEFKDFFEAVCSRKSAELKYKFHKNHNKS